MKRSPGPDALLGVDQHQAASASASSSVTRRAMRSVSASRGRCTPGRSTSTSCQSGPVATPRIARRVVCGLSETIATLVADDRVGERRLADVRPAGERDEPRPRPSPAPQQLAPAARASRPRRSRGPCRRGAARRGRRPRAARPCARGQITTSPSSRGPAGSPPSPSIAKESTSVGASFARCSRLSSRIRSGPDELDRHVTVVDTGAAAASAARGARSRPRPARRHCRRCRARASGLAGALCARRSRAPARWACSL